MTYEEIITEAAAASKAYDLTRDSARRYKISQIIAALPEDQRIAAMNVLNPPRACLYG